MSDASMPHCERCHRTYDAHVKGASATVAVRSCQRKRSAQVGRRVSRVRKFALYGVYSASKGNPRMCSRRSAAGR
jgi:hypothetical protein